MLKNFFLTAWRNLARNKAYAFTNLAGLSIGLASVMLILLYIKDEISFDRFQAKAPQIYRLVSESLDQSGHEGKGGTTGGPAAGAFLQSIPDIRAACRMRSGQALIKKGGDIIQEYPFYADTSFFNIFSFPLLAGDPSRALSAENDIVLSVDGARKYFNSTDVIGKTLSINTDGQFETFTVTAVAANTPLNSSIRFDLLMPIQRTLHQPWGQSWTNSFLNTFFLLRPGANIPAVEQQMTAIFERNNAQDFAAMRKQHPNIYYRFKLQPFLQMHLDGTYNANNGIHQWSDSSYSYILGSIALFILLIASINFINLSLARSLRRGKEIGVRKISGSTRGQLIAQFISESFLLNLFAFIPAFLLVQLALPAFSRLTNKELSILYLFQPSTLALFAVLVIINTLLSGVYPAMVLSGFTPVQTLYGKFRLTGRNYLGKSMVVLQFVIAIFLICGTTVMQRQFRFMLRKDPGYEAAGVAYIPLPDNSDQKSTAAFRDALAGYPFIRSAGLISSDYMNDNTTQITIGRRDVSDVAYFQVDQQVLPLLKIPFVAGHNFTGSPIDSLSCIINGSMVREAGWKDPIGQQIQWDGHAYTVVGVVKDFHTASMHEKIHPALILGGEHFSAGNVLVRIDPKAKEAALTALRSSFKTIYPFYPWDYGFMDDILADQYQDDKRWMTIVTIAAALAIFISCLGLFGLATLSIEQRVKEIGVRKVLGGGILKISFLLSRDFVRLVLIAFFIGAPLAWYFSNRWLQDYAYRIDLSWGLFLAVGAGILTITLLTVGIRASRAAATNPGISLRSE
jgi:putative ABC transport system permease protein